MAKYYNLSVLIGILLFSGGAAAEVANAGVVSHRNRALPASVSVAFIEGSIEGPLPSAGEFSPMRARELEEAERAVDKGKEAYLDVKLKRAERSFRHAVDLYLADPAALVDSKKVSKAAVLLAQIQLARKRKSAAKSGLKRVLLAIPRFPEGTQPPPNVAALIKAVQRELAARLNGQLKVTSSPSGLPVWANATALGRTPVEVGDLLAGSLVVRIEGPGGVRQERVDLKQGLVTVHFGLTAERESAALREGLAQRSASASWTAAAQLQRVMGTDYVCVAVLEESRVIVARLRGAERVAIGGHVTQAPTNLDGWRALGRFCSPSTPSNIGSSEVEAALFGSSSSASDAGFGRSGWGWTAIGVGTVTTASGIYFGLKAKDFETDWLADGREADREDARTQAIIADAAYTLSAALIITGIYLLVTD